jgi:heme oxygenase
MKKSQIKTKEYLKDLESILEIVDKIDNLNPETTDLKLFNKILKNKKKQMKKKYKDNLDTKK